MTALEITTAVTLVANILSEAMTDDELALYAAVFAQLGDTLATIAVIKTADEESEKEEC